MTDLPVTVAEDSDYEACAHMDGVQLNLGARLVQCRECMSFLDPFEVLIDYARCLEDLVHAESGWRFKIAEMGERLEELSASARLEREKINHAQTRRRAILKDIEWSKAQAESCADNGDDKGFAKAEAEMTAHYRKLMEFGGPDDLSP